MKKDDLILDLLKEVREDQKSHSIILVEVQKDVAKNTEDLADHIEGVKQNRARIEKLEEPKKAFGVFKKYLIGAGGIAAAIIGIIKLINLY